jgi:tetratricopeptide (TPR) repeat protein
MFCTMLMCCALVGDDGRPVSGGLADLAAYKAASAAAAGSADAQVKLALWCEAHGLTKERLTHLAAAVAAEPGNALARGLLGLVAHQGKWERPEVVAQQIENDPAQREPVREYLDRRVKADMTPGAQLSLAVWCERKGLTAQALAHYNEVIRLDPSRADVWRHLGYRKQGNRWLKAEEIVAQEREAVRQKLADKRWKPILAKLRDDLDSTNPLKRARAQERLSEVTDPRAMPMIWAHFVRGSEQQEHTAVQLLGQIDSPAAANGLAAMAVFSPRPQVRGQATSTLTERDPRDVVEPLIDLVRKPFNYEVRPGTEPGSTGELFVEGEKYNVRRLYQNQTTIPALWGGRFFSPSVAFDPFGTQNLPAAPRGDPMLLVNQDLGTQQDLGIAYQLRLRQQTEAGLKARMDLDIRTIERVNAGMNRLNDRALAVLIKLTGKDFGADSEKWKVWWTDHLGYAYQSQPDVKPTYTTFVTEPLPAQFTHHSCFGARTLVRTVDGPRTIESIQVGDRVLSQSTTTGSLEFRPVLAVYHNKPAATLKLSIGGEPIVATNIHRFWKVGKGWTMAREMKAGDRVRVVGGVAEIQSIVPDAVQPVFNFEVGENRDYFVGKQGMLVHDNSLVQAVLDPFDQEPDLAALAPAFSEFGTR